MARLMKHAGLLGISRDMDLERSEARQVVATLELSYRGAVRATAACPRAAGEAIRVSSIRLVPPGARRVVRWTLS